MTDEEFVQELNKLRNAPCFRSVYGSGAIVAISGSGGKQAHSHAEMVALKNGRIAYTKPENGSLPKVICGICFKMVSGANFRDPRLAASILEAAKGRNKNITYIPLSIQTIEELTVWMVMST